MKPKDKLTMARMFGIIALVMAAVVVAAIVAFIIVNNVSSSAEVLNAFSVVLVLSGTILGGTAAVISFIGYFLARSADKAGEPEAGRVKRLCLTAFACAFVVFFAYLIAFGTYAGA